MNVDAGINIVLQSFCGLVSLLMILFLRFVRKKRTSLDNFYIRFLVVNTVLLFLNVLSWYYDGKPGAGVHILLVAVDFLLYSCHYVLLGTMTDYLALFLEQQGVKCKNAVRIVWGIAIFGITLIVLSQFNGMYYTIDAQNNYVRQDGVFLFAMIGVTGLLVDLYLFLHHRKRLPKEEGQTFTVLLIVSLLASTIQAFVYGVFYLYITTTFVAVCIYIFIQVEQTRKISEKELELEKSHTAIMLSQIQPHFLYNSLTAIKSLCSTDPLKAKEAIVYFSNYLRGNMDSLTIDTMIPFEKELSHIETYLALEKMRFGEALKVNYEISCLYFLLPVLSVQPLVENAVRYGITKKEDGGTLTIMTNETDAAIIITVSDDGRGFDLQEKKDQSLRSHIGIENVKNRLALQCGGTLSITSEKGIGTTAIVIIPKGESLNEHYSCR